jgi:glycosyltransferase involved in cell wall biosynthesis
MAQLLRERLGVEAETIYDGVDRRYFFHREHIRPCSSDGGPLRVLFAGSLRVYKRARMVVQQAVRWPEAEFRIAGRGEEESACRRFAAEQGCRNVCFLGHLTPQQLGEEMRSASVFFFPSVIEGHPQVLLQAAACGLPSVAMNLYHPEYVVDGETGFLANSDAELVDRLATLLRDDQLRAAMSRAAIIRARNFEWEGAASAWARTFENAFSSRKTASR